MKKCLQASIVMMLVVFSVSVVAIAQSPMDIVDKMGVVSIKSVEVQPTKESAVHYLNVLTELKNDNDKELKLTKADFTFFIQDVKNTNYMVDIGPAACIINDVPNANLPVDFVCPGKKDDIILPPNAVVNVLFAVEMGRNRPVLETIIHILNFVGKPLEGRYLFIKGRFDLGIKSERGWTYAEALRVEWMFCPTIQDKLPLIPCFPK